MTSGFSNRDLPKISLSEIDEEAEDNKTLEPFRKECKDTEFWAKDEVECLIRGVEKYGHSWRRILRKYSGTFQEGRRIIDLKTKYDQLNKSTSYYKTNKKNWIMMNENEDPTLDALGEIIVVTQRFPYDAARKFAMKKYSSGERSFIVRVREAENLSNIHIYEYVEYLPFSSRIKLRKLTYRRKDECTN